VNIVLLAQQQALILADPALIEEMRSRQPAATVDASNIQQWTRGHPTQDRRNVQQELVDQTR
jgi:hypothetical protein